MKELKYNIKYLLKKKELYFMIIFLLLVVIANVVLVSAETLSRIDDYKETIETAEYLQIFSNFSSWLLCPICILCITIIISLVFCDISWLEKKGKIDYLLCNRLNYKKNIMIRFLLSIFGTFLLVFLALILDYLCLVYLFGSGTKVDYSGGTAFNIYTSVKFLKELFYSNPFLHSVICNLHIALIFGLVTGLSYSLSFYFKQKVLIYFISPVFFLIMEVIFSSFSSIRNLSILNQLQLIVGPLYNAFILYGSLFIASIILVLFYINKKDVSL